MKVDLKKLHVILAKKLLTMSSLHAAISTDAIAKIKSEKNVNPKVVGKIARYLDVDVTDLV